MHIAIDARELLGHPTGVGRYLACLLDAWCDRGLSGGHDVTLLTPEPLPRPALARWEGRGIAAHVVPGGRGTWWEQAQVARALRRVAPDVLFAPAYTAPLLAPVPTVLTVHDVSFMARPEWFGWREGLRRRWLTRAAVRKARLVLTVSRFSAAELTRLLSLPPERIRIIHSGVPVPEGVAGEEEPLLAASKGPIVLFVGAIFNRRQLPLLIRAFARVVRQLPPARLIVVGENRTHPHEDLAGLVASLGLGSRVTLTDYLEHGRLAALYRSASAFAFLSEYEGFGLPPLEALAAGVPALLADTAVAREICGDAALYVPVGDEAKTAEALLALLTEEGLRRRLLTEAPGVLGRYSWTRAARETMAALEEAAGRSR